MSVLIIVPGGLLRPVMSDSQNRPGGWRQQRDSSQHHPIPQHTHLGREEASELVVELRPLWSWLRPPPQLEQNCVQVQDFRMFCAERPVILTVLSGFQKSRTTLA